MKRRDDGMKKLKKVLGVTDINAVPFPLDMLIAASADAEILYALTSLAFFTTFDVELQYKTTSMLTLSYLKASFCKALPVSL